MARIGLDVILRILKRGKGLQQTTKETKDLTRAGKLLKQMFAGAAILGAAKLTLELTKTGAQALRTERAFGNLSGGTELASDNLEAMQKATQGAMSEAKMMGAASKLMSMGLADNAEDLERVSEMAVVLGSAFGRKATVSLEDFSLMLANQSIPRLDTFGISAGKARIRINELMKTVPGMTRETAFMTATMELGSAAMERLGGAAVDDALQFERLEAAADDLKVEIGKRLAPVLGDAVETLMLLLNWNEKVEEAVEEHHDAVKEIVGSYDDYVKEMLRANGMAQEEIDWLYERKDEYQDQADWLEKLIRDYGLMTAEEHRAGIVAKATIDDRRRQVDWTQRARLSLEDYTAATEDDRLKQIDWGKVLEGNVQRLQWIEADLIDVAEAKAEAAHMGDLFTEALIATQEGLDKLTADEIAMDFYAMADAAEADAPALMTLAGALGLYTDEQLEAAWQNMILQAKMEELAEKFAAGEISIGDAKLLLWEFRREMEEMPDSKTITLTTHHIDTYEQQYAGGPQKLQRGAWNVEEGLYHLDPGEMVVPAGPAQQIRSSVQHFNRTDNVYVQDVAALVLFQEQQKRSQMAGIARQI